MEREKQSLTAILRAGAAAQSRGRKNSSGKKRPRPASDGSWPALVPSKPVDCPLCGRSFLASVVALHASECVGDSREDKHVHIIDSLDVSTPTGPSCDVVASPLQGGSSQTERLEGRSKSLKFSPPAGKNAFGFMMKAASVRPRPERFICQMSPDTRCVSALWHVDADSEVRSARYDASGWVWKSSVELFKTTEYGGEEKGAVAAQDETLPKGKPFCEPAPFRGSKVLVASEFPSLGDSGMVERDFGCALVGAVRTFPFFRGALERYFSRWRQGKGATSLTQGTLKSLLQKSVRRGLGCAAIFLSVELLLCRDRASGALDLQSFFRRMPIIMVEDSIVHPELCLLVWVMLANTKGYIPGPAVLSRCLRVVLQVAMARTSDTIGFGGGDSEEVDSIQGGLWEGKALERIPICQIDTVIQSRLQSCQASTLVRSILARASFGGMGGDTKMLYRHAAVWCERFSSKSGASDVSTREKRWIDGLTGLHEIACKGLTAAIPAASLLVLKIPIAGIDFHCSPWMMDQLEQHCSFQGNQQEGKLRSAMWLFHSSVNVRRALRPDDFPGLRSKAELDRDSAWSSAVALERLKKEQELKLVWDRIREKTQEICRGFLAERCGQGILFA